MARISIIFLEAIILYVILCMPSVVIGDDTVPVPFDKAQVNAWFTKNIGPPASRKATLDPALAAAEAAPAKIITVKANGGGNFKTLTDAVNSIPVGNKARVVIKLGPGKYTEKVTIPKTKPFVTLIGDPKSMPVIVFGGTAAKYGTVDSASLIVESDYFVAANIMMVNSAPRPVGQVKGGQAEALRIGGDKAAFYNCKLYGFQDTLCDDKGLHLFKDCYIEGTVDFIFGNGKSIYLNSEIHVIPGEKECWITAQARHNAQEDTGYSFLHATITGSGRNAFLGRSWMPYARVVFAYSEMSDVVQPLGWSDNHNPATQKTSYFGEFACKGAGSNLATRAPFVKRLTAPQAHPFLTLGFIQASKWLLPPPQF